MILLGIKNNGGKWLACLVMVAAWLGAGVPWSAVAQTEMPQTTFTGRALVIDGDTIHVRGGGKLWKVRIYGVDAPEMDSMAGVMAKKQMTAILTKSNFWVSCLTHVKDVYGRVVAVCYAGKKLAAGKSDKDDSINLAMLRAGYGFAYRHFLTADDFHDYLAAEQAARDGRRGFWADDEFVRAYRQKKHF